MGCSPSQENFSEPDQRAFRTIAIKLDVREVKQLDDRIIFLGKARRFIFKDVFPRCSF
jgi:hypothetical protein